MNGTPRPADVPVEVVFGGCHPDERTVRLCVEAARSLTPGRRVIEGCRVLVTDEGSRKEIRIDVRTAEGEVLVERVTTAAGGEQLRAALQSSFVQVGRAIDDARRDRPGPLPGGAGEGETRAGTPPPCTWYG